MNYAGFFAIGYLIIGVIFFRLGTSELNNVYEQKGGSHTWALVWSLLGIVCICASIIRTFFLLIA